MRLIREMETTHERSGESGKFEAPTLDYETFATCTAVKGLWQVWVCQP